MATGPSHKVRFLTCASQPNCVDRPRFTNPVSSKSGMGTILSELRYAVRLFRRAPGLRAVAVGTLALGIGANTAILSAMDTVFIKGLPYPQPDRVMMMWEEATAFGLPQSRPAPGNYTEWTRLTRSFTALARPTARRRT
jgi:hypothetical protein